MPSGPWVSGSSSRCFQRRRRASRHCWHCQRHVGGHPPWRHRRSEQSGADRENADRRQRWHRPVSHRGSQAGHLHGQLHAHRLQRLPARGRRADRILHGHDQCRNEARHIGGNGHRHRREPDRRRAERAAANRVEQRRPQGDSDGPELQRDGRRRPWRRDEHQRRANRHVNQIHGSFLYSGTGKKLQSDNSEGTNFERDPNPTHDLIKVTEQCSTGCAANGNRPGIVYRSQDWGQNYTGSYIWKANLAYVTGRHSFKVGYQHTLMTDERT